MLACPRPIQRVHYSHLKGDISPHGASNLILVMHVSRLYIDVANLEDETTPLLYVVATLDLSILF